MRGAWPAGTERCFAFLRGVPILQHVDESALWQLATCGEDDEFFPGEVVMREGDASDCFHIVRGGQAVVKKRDSMGIEQPVARLGCGSYFGELGLLTNSPRSATIEVADGAPLRTYKFNAQTFHRVIAEQVLVFRLQRVQKRAGSRSGHAWMGLRSQFDIRDLPFLADTTRAERSFLQNHARIDRFDPWETVFWQCDTADRFYVVLEGSVHVDIDGEVVAEIGPGQFFGETALLLDRPRTATIRTTGMGLVAWSISRKAFQHIVGRYLLRDDVSRKLLLARMAQLEAEERRDDDDQDELEAA